MNTGHHRNFKLPKNSRKEKDEDLLLFREMFKREKERTMSLLQPVSDEFEPGHGEISLDIKILLNIYIYICKMCMYIVLMLLFLLKEAHDLLLKNYKGNEWYLQEM